MGEGRKIGKVWGFFLFPGLDVWPAALLPSSFLPHPLFIFRTSYSTPTLPVFHSFNHPFLTCRALALSLSTFPVLSSTLLVPFPSLPPLHLLHLSSALPTHTACAGSRFTLRKNQKAKERNILSTCKHTHTHTPTLTHRPEDCVGMNQGALLKSLSLGNQQGYAGWITLKLEKQKKHKHTLTQTHMYSLSVTIC